MDKLNACIEEFESEMTEAERKVWMSLPREERQALVWVAYGMEAQVSK